MGIAHRWMLSKTFYHVSSSYLMERRESGENSLRDRFDDEELLPLVIQSWLEHR